MAKQSFNEYPYGQFPTNFTKNGQKKHFEELTNNEQKASAMSVSTDPPSSIQNNNSFDISKLLPLLKMMSDKKSMTSSDMLNMFIPLLGGSSNNISELMSLLTPSKPSDEIEEDIFPSNVHKIDEYKRIE